MGRKLLKDQIELKEEVLKEARKIIVEEGVSELSIRKITKRINYSPGSVYHHFKGKNEILECLLTKEYGNIIQAVSRAFNPEKEPEKELQDAIRAYVLQACKAKELYKAFMLSDIPSIQKKTSILTEDNLENKQALKALVMHLERGIKLGVYRNGDVEQIAKIIWTSIFGLTLKVILEEFTNRDQLEDLMEAHISMVLFGIKNERGLEEHNE